MLKINTPPVEKRVLQISLSYTFPNSNKTASAIYQYIVPANYDYNADYAKDFDIPAKKLFQTYCLSLLPFYLGQEGKRILFCPDNIQSTPSLFTTKEEITEKELQITDDLLTQVNSTFD